MYISSRHLQILNFFKVKPYSVYDLSLILNLSENIIRGDLLKLADCMGMKKFSLKKLQELASEDLSLREKIRKYQVPTSSERKLYIVLCLIESDMLNLSTLDKILGVNRRTLSNDLQELKKVFSQFNLSIESLNAIGLKLIGSEEDKLFLFTAFFMRVITEKDILPPIFDNFINDFENMDKEKNIEELVVELVEEKMIFKNSFTIIAMNMFIYIYFKREKNLIDESLVDIFLETELSKKGFSLFIKKSYVKILEKIYIKNTDLRSEYFKDGWEKAVDIIYALRKSLGYNFDISDFIITQILFRIKVIEWKRLVDAKEYYPYNNTIFPNYSKEFFISKKIFKTFLGELDSFDEILFFNYFLRLIQTLKKEQEKRRKKVTIIYKFINFSLMETICSEIFGKSDIEYEIYSFYTLRTSFKREKPEYILTFESIDIPQGNYKIINAQLPLTEIDIIRIKNEVSQ